MSIPTVLNVGGVFEPTHKYNNSAAMLLDYNEWFTAQTGSVHQNGIVATLFEMDLASSYQLVNNWIINGFHGQAGAEHYETWWNARQMIDILVDGKFWIVIEDEQGFVNAQCYGDSESAWDAYSLVEHDYMKACGDFDPCSTCGENGHGSDEHENRSGSSYFNEAGEPLMTAAQARFEAYLDAEPRDPYDD